MTFKNVDIFINASNSEQEYIKLSIKYEDGYVITEHATPENLDVPKKSMVHLMNKIYRVIETITGEELEDDEE